MLASRAPRETVLAHSSPRAYARLDATEGKCHMRRILNLRRPLTLLTLLGAMALAAPSTAGASHGEIKAGHDCNKGFEPDKEYKKPYCAPPPPPPPMG